MLDHDVVTYKPSLVPYHLIVFLYLFFSFIFSFKSLNFSFFMFWETSTISLASLVSSCQGTYYVMLRMLYYEFAMYLERNKHFEWLIGWYRAMPVFTWTFVLNFMIRLNFICVCTITLLINISSAIFLPNYRKTSNISRTLVGNKIVDNSDAVVIGASPVGDAPTKSSLST